MKCHQCDKIRRCDMFRDLHVTPALLVYLCPPCSRELGYWIGAVSNTKEPSK
jgi:hypothetical protein